MNANAVRELNEIKAELYNIIRELESIKSGVRGNFQGIGNERCASCIENVIQNYNTVRRKLNNINTSNVREGF